MALSIKNSETERLARALAERTGETVTEAVTAALRSRLSEVMASGAERDRRLARIRRIAADSGPRWPEHLRHVSHDELLYDDRGLPR